MAGEGLILPGNSDELITPDDVEIVDIDSMIAGIFHALGELEQKLDQLHEKHMALENRMDLINKTVSEICPGGDKPC